MILSDDPTHRASLADTAHPTHTAMHTTTHTAAEDTDDYVTAWSVTSVMLRLIPLVLLTVVAIFGYRFCVNQNARLTDAQNPRANSQPIAPPAAKHDTAH